jgi:hypothetical protein
MTNKLVSGNGGKTESISSKIWNEIRVSLSPLLPNLVFEFLATDKAREKKKDINSKGRGQIIPSCRYMILYSKDSEDYSRKFLDLLSVFSKETAYKLNIQNLSSFSLTNMLRKKSGK